MLVLSVESMVEVKEMEAAHVTSAKAVVLLHDTSFNSSRKPKLLRLIPEGELFVFNFVWFIQSMVLKFIVEGELWESEFIGDQGDKKRIGIRLHT